MPTPTLTIYIPTCLSKELLSSENRSASVRVLIESFFEENIEQLMEFTCKKPRFKTTSVSISKYKGILNNLVNLKIFISRSEALRFIMLHAYLNQKYGFRIPQSKKVSSKQQVLNLLDLDQYFSQWISVKEINKTVKIHHNYIYTLLTELRHEGKVERKYEVQTVGAPITLWRLIR